jgi:hypothetical protein
VLTRPDALNDPVHDDINASAAAAAMLSRVDDGIAPFVSRGRVDEGGDTHIQPTAGYLSAAYFDPVTRTGPIVLRNADDQHFDVLGVCLQALEIAVGARK